MGGSASGAGTTYGLRHRASGRFVMMVAKEGDSTTNEEICRLALEPDGFHESVRWEVADPDDLVRTLRTDRKWWASSRSVPSWGRVDPKDCIPTAFVRTAVLDSMGGDPVAVTETACAMRLPGWFEGTVHRTRDAAPVPVLRRAFGAAFAGLGTLEDLELAVLDVAGHPAEVGMMLETGRGNTAQVAALADLPEDWPRDRDSGLGDRTDGLLLAACRLEGFEMRGEPVPYAELDADLGPAP